MDFRYNKTAKFVDQLNSTCNKIVNGITLNAYEVILVKMTGVKVQDLENHECVNVYAKWLH